MYEAVRVAADGRTTPRRFALTLSNAGFDGMVLRTNQSAPIDPPRESIATEYGIDVVRGIEIETDDKAVASGAIGNWRPKAEVLILNGRDPEMNRFAAESPRVDVLADPMGGDGDLNHVIARAAAENGVAIEVSLGRVLRRSGGPRVQAISNLRKLHDLIEDAGAPFVVSGTPETHLQVRGARELVAVGEKIGFSADEIETGLRTWGTIAERIRERRDPKTVVPGVTVESEKDDT